MAFTAFGQQMPEQKKAWVKETIKAYRENFFFEKWLGKGENSIIQTIKELRATEKGDRAVIPLVHDLRPSGVVSDNDIEGRREALESSWIEIHTDQLRKGVHSKGRVDDQRSVLDFRTEAKDKLAYWRAQIQEELIILTASGVSYNYNTDGSERAVGAEDDLRDLEFAGDVAPPTSNRHYYYDGTNLQPGDTSAITAACVPKYGMIVDMMAEARIRGIKPLKVGGHDHYVWLCHPKTFAALKKDPDFRDAVINAGERGRMNPIFTGATLTIDGLIIHTNMRTFNTRGAAAGSKWGANGNVDGVRTLLMGCQALGHADLWKSASWYEGKEDDDARNIISISQYWGVRKLKFKSRLDGDTEQDFGLICLDLAL